jgi:hypothetical protein
VKRVAVVVLVGVVYAWWASGVAPFTTLAYVLVAIPSLLALSVYVSLGALSPRRKDVRRYYHERSKAVTLKSVAPWLVVLALAIVLEVVGLALGGRSHDVPTLSTTVDHLLVWHWGRWLFYLAWLFSGVTPVFRLWQFHEREVG